MLMEEILQLKAEIVKKKKETISMNNKARFKYVLPTRDTFQ